MELGQFIILPRNFLNIKTCKRKRRGASKLVNLSYKRKQIRDQGCGEGINEL